MATADELSIELAENDEDNVAYISKLDTDQETEEKEEEVKNKNKRNRSKESSWKLGKIDGRDIENNKTSFDKSLRPRQSSITSSFRSLPSLSFSTQRPIKILPLVPLRNYLLFTGIEKPPIWYSLWWISYIGWRLFVLLSLFASVSNIIGFHNKKHWLVNFYLLPAAFATFTAGCSWIWLPNVLKGLENQKGLPIIDEDMYLAKKIFTLFFIINFIFSFILASLKMSVSASTSTYSLFAIIFLECSGGTVILGGVLLILTIETILAKKEVNLLLLSSQTYTLTRESYIEGIKSIELRSQRWKHPLNSLAFVACYCTICLIIIQTIIYKDTGQIRKELFSNYDDDDVSAIEIDLEIIIVLSKELFLLLCIMFLVMGINDEADAITSELLNKTWGPIGSQHDCIRMDLLLLTTTIAPPSSSITSWYHYFTISKTRPITFEVLGFRITRDYVLAVGLSLLLALVNVIHQGIQ